MKKIFLLLILISAYSCKKNESKTTNEIITNKKDTTSLQKEAEIKLTSDNTYDCDGVMTTDSSARIQINLPEETPANKYIFKVYNASNKDSNKIVIHLRDNKGGQLIHKGNKYNYFLNFGVIIRGKGAWNLDTNRPTYVSVFHENDISDEKVKEFSSVIFEKATNYKCAELIDKLNLKKGGNQEALTTPKTCGLGTIRPLNNE